MSLEQCDLTGNKWGREADFEPCIAYLQRSDLCAPSELHAALLRTSSIQLSVQTNCTSLSFIRTLGLFEQKCCTQTNTETDQCMNSSQEKNVVIRINKLIIKNNEKNKNRVSAFCFSASSTCALHKVDYSAFNHVWGILLLKYYDGFCTLCH